MVNLRSYNGIRYVAQLVTFTAPRILTHTFQYQYELSKVDKLLDLVIVQYHALLSS
jgi:hypothetical protein